MSAWFVFGFLAAQTFRRGRRAGSSGECASPATGRTDATPPANIYMNTLDSGTGYVPVDGPFPLSGCESRSPSGDGEAVSSWPDWLLYLLAGAISAASFFALYHIAKAVSA